LELLSLKITVLGNVKLCSPEDVKPHAHAHSG